MRMGGETAGPIWHLAQLPHCTILHFGSYFSFQILSDVSSSLSQPLGFLWFVRNVVGESGRP